MFGLDMARLIPYVLVVGTAVVRLLAAVVSGAVRDEVRDERRRLPGFLGAIVSTVTYEQR